MDDDVTVATWRLALIGCAVSIWSQLAWGQTPSAQTAPPPPPGLEAKAEFALVSTSGNADSQTIGTSGEITMRPPNWVVSGKIAFIRQEAEDIVNAKSLTTRERVSRVLTPRLQAFGQHTYLRDLFAGVEHRNNVEGGMSYELLRVGRHTLFTDAGLGYLNEQRTVPPALSTPVGTVGTRYKLRFSETSDLTDDFNASFDFDSDGTWRLNHVIALTARIAAMFSLKVSNQLRFVDEPVPGFERTDRVTSAALVFDFAR
jgi:putative salt-induced outer membrane protein YdiY